MGKSTRTRILTDQELKLFFESFDLKKKSDWYYYHVFRLQYLTALRISDLMNLKVDQVSSKNFYIKEKKTGKRREVYLCDEAFTLSKNISNYN
ncbi:MAG: tyrosine-type recombinase/integrase [Candidatus Cloacimonetes bacterium]|nr:tyrosine-type recombinase/integrase [Candidatus Cloacimonadota bacterium]MCF7883416.1 tyrosine-type recombinase/integrase [Candidatus Cloacimonadota bacterium]